MARRGERIRAATIALAALVGAPACGDQAFVSYVGTVTEAPADVPTGASFEDEPPADAAPIAGATVSLCAESKCTATSDETGLWGPIWQSFPLFRRRGVTLTVSADGYEPFTYSARYPATEDPLFAEKLMNVRLRPLAPPAAEAPSATAPEAP